jgi:hypothetical protein
LDFEEDSLCILLLEQEEYMIWDRLNWVHFKYQIKSTFSFIIEEEEEEEEEEHMNEKYPVSTTTLKLLPGVPTTISK